MGGSSPPRPAGILTAGADPGKGPRGGEMRAPEGHGPDCLGVARVPDSTGVVPRLEPA